MSPLPTYVGTITIVGIAGILAATSAALYRGRRDTGAGRRAAAATAAASAVLFGAWAVASALIAHHGGYRTQLGKQPPWLPIEATVATAVLLLLARIPAVSRGLAGPSTVRLLSWPHTFRVAGVALVISMWMGHLPALFAIPAGLGDITVGVVEPLLSRRIRTGHARRATLWFNLFGITDLVTAMVLGGLTAYGIVHVSPANSALSQLPLALIPTVGVPTLFALHVLTLRRLPSAPQREATPAPTRPETTSSTATRAEVSYR
jgi:hypothetical protein